VLAMETPVVVLAALAVAAVGLGRCWSSRWRLAWLGLAAQDAAGAGAGRRGLAAWLDLATRDAGWVLYWPSQVLRDVRAAELGGVGIRRRGMV
jgi:hypothetical protein